MSSRPRLVRFISYAAFAVGMVLTVLWLELIQLRLEVSIAWTAAMLATAGFILGIVAFGGRRRVKPPVSLPSLAPALVLNAGLAALLGATLLYFLALPAISGPPHTEVGQPLVGFQDPLPAVGGGEMSVRDLAGRPAVVMLYRGHW